MTHSYLSRASCARASQDCGVHVVMLEAERSMSTAEDRERLLDRLGDT